MADKALDCKPYNDKGVEKVDGIGNTYMDYSCTWETCTLRKWLNEDFYRVAFDEDEKRDIKNTTVVNDYNIAYGTEGGKKTIDKIYLLSESEVQNESYGFSHYWDSSSKTRCIKPTELAKKNGAYAFKNSGNCYWWLRSPGSGSSNAAFVDYDGAGHGSGDLVTSDGYGVCPVLHINLKSSHITYAGMVSSDGTTGYGSIGNRNEFYRNPIVSYSGSGITTWWACVYFGKYE